MRAANLNGTSDMEPVSSSAMRPRPIDLVHLATYTLGDRSLESELLGLFRKQTGIYLERLATAVSDKDWQDAAHSLKGSSRAVGALALADLAAMAEQGTVTAHDMFRQRMIAELEAEIEAVNLYIENLISA